MEPSTLRPYPTSALSPRDEQRLAWARSMVAAMTPAEKIAQLHQYSPGVERLGIGPFTTGTEGLHGVAWRGPSTQFPQPIGMAASWDPELLRSAAAVIAAEVRAMHEADPRTSLNVWAPVVNPLRHPRWGRSEEAYTEDPLLNGELACGFSAGLRGDGETWTTLPTLKHFLAYSNETDRDATSSDLSPRVLHEYELPGHITPLVRGWAGSVMLSYNLVNGRPAHVTELLEKELRSRLADQDLLFVVSDAGAPSNLFRSQKVAVGPAEAYAAMLRAGVDSFTDNDSDPTETVAALTEALDRGLIDQAHLDRAVVRQLVARARTGEFEKPAASASVANFGRINTSASTPMSPSSASLRPGAEGKPPAHVAADRTAARSAGHALAREVATRSAVLLARRDPAALPLRPGRTAVIGEQAHTVLRDWYSGEFHQSTSIATALEEQPARPEVRTTRALDVVSLAAAGPVPLASDSTPGPRSEPVLLYVDGSLRCARPAADGPMPASSAAARFEVLDFGDDVIALREAGTQLLITPDDRGRLTASAERIGGWVVQETFRRIADENGTWRLQHTGSGRFVGVEHHSGALTLRDHTPASGNRFSVQTHEHGTDAFDSAARGAESVVLVVGNDPHVHGRETEDRSHLQLPAPARAAAERLAALPDDVATVLVITSSYPYDLEGLEEHVGAVIWSSHAGEAEGEALAALLTGRRDFSGRLAQTWPDSSPLPSLLDYDVIGAGSTYLYGQGARFAFGHGLSVDRCEWSDVEITAGDEALQVTVTLTAPGERATQGPLHEVVQVYADVPEAAFARRPYTVPATRLVGFDVVALDGPEAATATITVPYQRLALYAPDREGWELPDGPLTVRLARSSTETVRTQEITIPHDHLNRHALPAASGDLVAAHRAEETVGLARSAASLLEGTELRPLTLATTGTADFVLEAGTVITALETRALDLGALAPMAGTAELIDPEAADPSAPALPLPHRVRAAGARPTGRVRVRLSGPLALTGLRAERP